MLQKALKHWIFDWFISSFSPSRFLEVARIAAFRNLIHSPEESTLIQRAFECHSNVICFLFCPLVGDSVLFKVKDRTNNDSSGPDLFSLFIFRLGALLGDSGSIQDKPLLSSLVLVFCLKSPSQMNAHPLLIIKMDIIEVTSAGNRLNSRSPIMGCFGQPFHFLLFASNTLST